MQELFPEEYDFYPRSWILPEEYQQFATQVSIKKKKTYGEILQYVQQVATDYNNFHSTVVCG